MRYAFGTFVFDDTSLELTRQGRPARLEPQPARALAVLLAGAGDVVSRDDLRTAIWGEHTHVDYDRGLAYCLAQVRTALGDSAENPRFVQTLPKRGFRFIAPVTTVADGRAAPDPAPAPRLAVPPASTVELDGGAVFVPRRGSWFSGRAPWLTGVAALMVLALIWVRADTPPRPAIVAVAIFDNETGDASFDRFATGLSDVVVTRLTHLAPERVGVIGNAAPLRQPRAIRNLRTLAATVQADYIVIGQLQRQDAGLRFILHFIRLRDEVHLSAQRMIRPTMDVAGLEDDVVQAAERVVGRHLVGTDAP